MHCFTVFFLTGAFCFIQLLIVSATAFYKCQPVVEFMCEILRKQQQELHQHRPLSDAERLKFTKEIKGTGIMCLSLRVL